MICVLSGGTGGAKFVDGLRQAMPAEDITLVVNTGDDLLWWGLYVSPDIDSITYVLRQAQPRARMGRRATLSSARRLWGTPAS
jgi:LPPG:FO 2-phospho-L-lactate transferase